MVTAAGAREKLVGHSIWVWFYLHPDWQWEQSRHWHEDRYALAISEALDIMKSNPDFKFFFDSTSEFYSAVGDRLGPRLDELKDHVRSGRVRLVSGQVANTRPTQVGGEETFVRNLQLGREFFEEHLPEAEISLFHSVDIVIGGVQMPQILRQAGFEYYRAWRPHGPMNALGVPHQFIWRGIDGSEIVVTRGAYGYVGTPESALVRYADDWDKAVAWLYENHLREQMMLDRSPSQQLWVIQGYDDARPMTLVRADEPFDVLGLVEQWQQREGIPAEWCTPLEFSQAVAERRDSLQVVDGVLDGADAGYNMANHGAHGLWMWRQMNDRRLVGAECWAAVAESAGIIAPWQDLKKLWYQHCVYQAHAQDFAFEDDWNDLVELARDVQYWSQQVARDAIDQIVLAAGGGTRHTRYIFNPNPWPASLDVDVYHACATAGVQSVEAVDEQGQPLVQQQLAEFRHPRYGGSINDEHRLVRVDLPAMGYCRIELRESSETKSKIVAAPEGNVVETADLRLVYRDQGLREVHDLKSGRSYASREGGQWPGLIFHVLDDQDWIFGGPELRRERFVAESSEWLKTGPIRWHHRSYGKLGPYKGWLDTVVADRGRELQVSVQLEGHWKKPPVTGFVTLMADIEAGGAMTVDSPFAVEPRDPDHDIYVNNVPQGEDLGNLNMFERLRPGVFWGRTWADWSGAGQGITLITVDGNYYWLKEPGQFGHVLLRCIALRDGTWEAFCPQTMTGTGAHNFRYVLCFHDGDWRQADLQHRAKELRNPPVVARAYYPSEATLPHGSHSFLRLDGPALLTAFYRSGESIHARFYECEGKGGDVKLVFDWEPASATAVDLVGNQLDIPIRIDGKRVVVQANPWQIVTLELIRR